MSKLPPIPLLVLTAVLCVLTVRELLSPLPVRPALPPPPPGAGGSEETDKDDPFDFGAHTAAGRLPYPLLLRALIPASAAPRAPAPTRAPPTPAGDGDVDSEGDAGGEGGGGGGGAVSADTAMEDWLETIGAGDCCHRRSFCLNSVSPVLWRSPREAGLLAE